MIALVPSERKTSHACSRPQSYVPHALGCRLEASRPHQGSLRESTLARAEGLYLSHSSKGEGLGERRLAKPWGGPFTYFGILSVHSRFALFLSVIRHS
jgi:hypothetical protein